MRGHITKRSEGSYSFVLDVGTDPATGRRKQQRVTVKGTKKDAEKRLGELIHQFDNGIFIRPGKTTLSEYLQRWIKEYAWPNLSPRTAEGYEHIINRHLSPGAWRNSTNSNQARTFTEILFGKVIKWPLRWQRRPKRPDSKTSPCDSAYRPRKCRKMGIIGS